MLRNRYEPMNLFELVAALGLELDPELAELDHLLEDDRLFQTVRADLIRRYPHTATRGRHSTPVEVILRMLVVKRLYRWSYAETEQFVGDSLVLRQFCRLYLERAPDDTTLLRWAKVIGPQTLGRVNERVVELARTLRVTRGRKLRVDSAVVETNIHHPTDSGLLGAGVRILGRLLRQAQGVVGEVPGLGKEAFRNHNRSVRRLAQQMHRVARRKGEEAVDQMKQVYGKLIAITRQTQAQAEKVCTVLRSRSERAARRLIAHFEQFLPRVAQGVSQSVRRVMDGEVVPAKEKILSLFEPHTQVIVRHKVGKPVEFGRGPGGAPWLEEVEGGIVSGYRLLDEPGQDDAYLEATLAEHRRRFGHPPWLLAGDRGVSSPKNERLAREAGVKRVVWPGGGRGSPQRRAHERQRWFRRGFRLRAGIEGRISVLRRGYGLARCPDHGQDGMGRYVGWGIVTANLAKIAQTVVRRSIPAAQAA
jgi:transposase, IS5 family